MADSTPYSTVQAAGSSNKPGWMNEMDAQRVMAYKTYEDMYQSNPGTFDLIVRGTDDLPIYIPTAKSLVNTLARYVARDFGFAVNPNVGTPQLQELAISTIQAFFTRENVLNMVASAKKENLKFGDTFFMLIGDVEKPQGRRISMKTVDPGMMFVRTLDDDPDRIVGWDMVEQIDINGTIMIQRQRWLKNSSPDHPNFGTPDAPIWYEKATMELDGWESPTPKGLVVVVENLFPANIVQLPIYHWKNNSETSNPYGSSELRGLERVIAAINQAVTDQDLALALAGLGVYKTSEGGPVDENGDEVEWQIGPGEVVEDEDFERVAGIGSIAPSLEHIKYLEAVADKAVGITDVTRGEVSSDVAASGIALAIRMAPTIDAASEKDLQFKGVMDQLLFDLKTWFQVFEGVNFVEADVTAAFGDKLPTNRQAEIKELMDMLAAGIVSLEYVHSVLVNRWGFQFPADMMKQIQDRKAADAALSDPFGDRSANPDDPAADPLVDENAV